MMDDDLRQAADVMATLIRQGEATLPDRADPGWWAARHDLFARLRVLMEANGAVFGRSSGTETLRHMGLRVSCTMGPLPLINAWIAKARKVAADA
jgi:hypothetical protein